MPTRRKKLIPVEREDIPQFTSEDEEATFWSTHTFGPRLRDEMRPDFDPDLPSPDEVRAWIDQKRGRGERGPRATPGSRGVPERTQPIPIRFDADVLKRLRALAERKHTGYQTLLKTFVVERLYEEELREGLVTPARTQAGVQAPSRSEPVRDIATEEQSGRIDEAQVLANKQEEDRRERRRRAASKVRRAYV